MSAKSHGHSSPSRFNKKSIFKRVSLPAKASTLLISVIASEFEPKDTRQRVNCFWSASARVQLNSSSIIVFSTKIYVFNYLSKCLNNGYELNYVIRSFQKQLISRNIVKFEELKNLIQLHNRKAYTNTRCVIR